MTTESSAIETSGATPTPNTSTARAAGLGIGWTKLGAAVCERLPVAQIERIWLFPPVRHEEREWGTAVVAVRVDDNRSQVYTGTYILTIRGRDRGRAYLSVEEVGAGPDDVLPEVIRGVQVRAGEAEAPVEIDPELWFPVETEDSPSTDAAQESATVHEPVQDRRS